jgi:MFS family permease
LPRYAAAFNATGWQLGLLMASFSAMQFLFAPAWGALSDRIGRRPVLLLGLAGSTVCYSLFGYVSSLGRAGTLIGISSLAWLFITRIGAGIAGATIPTAQAVIADCTTQSGRGRGMALIGAAFGLGFTVGPLIGAACVGSDSGIALTEAQLAEVRGWQESTGPMDADAMLQFLAVDGEVSDSNRRAVAMLLASPLETVEVQRILLQPPSGLPGYIAGVLSAAALVLASMRLPETRQAGTDAGSQRRGFRPLLLIEHLRAVRFRRILPAIFVTTFGFAQFESTLSLLTGNFGYDARWNFLLYAYVGFVLSIAQATLVRRLLPRVGEKRMATAGVLLMTTGFGLVAVMGAGVLPGVALWAILPVIVVGFSSVNPALQSLLSRSAGADEQGAVLGSGQSLSSLARILGPALGIPLLRWSVPMPYVLGSLLILAAGSLILRLQAPADEPAAAG